LLGVRPATSLWSTHSGASRLTRIHCLRIDRIPPRSELRFIALRGLRPEQPAPDTACRDQQEKQAFWPRLVSPFENKRKTRSQRDPVNCCEHDPVYKTETNKTAGLLLWLGLDFFKPDDFRESSTPAEDRFGLCSITLGLGFPAFRQDST